MERACGRNEVGLPFLHSLRSVLDTGDFTFTSYERTVCATDQDEKVHAEDPEEEEEKLVRRLGLSFREASP